MSDETEASSTMSKLSLLAREDGLSTSYLWSKWSKKAILSFCTKQTSVWALRSTCSALLVVTSVGGVERGSCGENFQAHSPEKFTVSVRSSFGSPFPLLTRKNMPIPIPTARVDAAIIPAPFNPDFDSVAMSLYFDQQSCKAAKKMLRKWNWAVAWHGPTFKFTP